MRFLASILLVTLVSSTMAQPFILNYIKNSIKKLKNSVKEAMETKSPEMTVNGKPWFCHDLDCPAFKPVQTIVVDKDTTIYERCYEESVWARTESTGKKDSSASKGMFKKLFNYIQGDNDKGVKIAMTAPVLTHVRDADKKENTINVQMNFFVPPSKVKDIPQPSASDVSIATQPPMCVYVITYGGWQMGVSKKLWQMKQRLVEGLTKKGLEDTYDADAGMFFAGYDAPYKLWNRHNEVMVLKKKTSPKINVKDV